MSRTYRKEFKTFLKSRGKYYTWAEYRKYQEEEYKELGVRWNIPSRGWQWINKLIKGRDKKPWNKPKKSFKKAARRRERAKVNQAMFLKKYENIPQFKKTDQYDWT